MKVPGILNAKVCKRSAGGGSVKGPPVAGFLFAVDGKLSDNKGKLSGAWHQTIPDDKNPQNYPIG